MGNRNIATNPVEILKFAVPSAAFEHTNSKGACKDTKVQGSTKGSKSEQAKGKPGSSSSGNSDQLYALVFYLIVGCMQIRESTVLIQSKGISMNASLQNKLNKAMDSVKFVMYSSKAGSKTLAVDQQLNQELSTIRDNFENDLITARQTGQVEMTEASSNVNILQQNASEGSAYLQTLNTIFKIIDEMTQPKGS